MNQIEEAIGILLEGGEANFAAGGVQDLEAEQVALALGVRPGPHLRLRRDARFDHPVGHVRVQVEDVDDVGAPAPGRNDGSIASR